MAQNTDADRRPWTAERVGDQSGRVAVVTGANTGVGFVVARVLAARGAKVVLACRDRARAQGALNRIAEAVPGADVGFQRLDLASLASVREAATALRTAHPRIDLLINNAGVMYLPFGLTEDGFERHLGVNHFGHFALTGLVLPALTAAPGSRVVVLGSPAHRGGTADFAESAGGAGYRRMAAYSRSKLANLMFAYELDRRLRAAGAPTAALAAHPGVARTELNRSLPLIARGPGWGVARPFTHSAEQGALGILRAATDPDAVSGEYYGPGGWSEFKGAPVLLKSNALSHNEEEQRRLWELSERLTEVEYRFS